MATEKLRQSNKPFQRYAGAKKFPYTHGSNVLESTNTQEECVHYWIIEPPNGHTSFARCKYCGATNEFFNNWQRALANIKSLPDGPAPGMLEDLKDEPFKSS